MKWWPRVPYPGWRGSCSSWRRRSLRHARPAEFLYVQTSEGFRNQLKYLWRKPREANERGRFERSFELAPSALRAQRVFRAVSAPSTWPRPSPDIEKPLPGPWALCALRVCLTSFGQVVSPCGRERSPNLLGSQDILNLEERQALLGLYTLLFVADSAKSEKKRPQIEAVPAAGLARLLVFRSCLAVAGHLISRPAS